MSRGAAFGRRVARRDVLRLDAAATVGDDDSYLERAAGRVCHEERCVGAGFLRGVGAFPGQLLVVQAVAGAMTPKAAGRPSGTVRSCGCVRMAGAESTETCNAVAVGTLVVQLASVRRRMPRVAEAVALGLSGSGLLSSAGRGRCAQLTWSHQLARQLDHRGADRAFRWVLVFGLADADRALYLESARSCGTPSSKASIPLRMRSMAA